MNASMWRDGTNTSPSGGRRGCRHPRSSCPLQPRFPHRFPRPLLPPPRPRRRYPHRSRYLCPARRSYRDPCYHRRGSLLHRYRYLRRSRYLCTILRSYRDPCYLRRDSPLSLHRYRYLRRSRYLCTILHSYRDPCYFRRGSLRGLRSHSLPSDRSRARIRLHSLLHPRPLRNPRPLYVYRPVSAAARP